jgi:hypothetical protein
VFSGAMKNYSKKNKKLVKLLCDKYGLEEKEFWDFHKFYKKIDTIKKFRAFFGGDGKVHKINRIMGDQFLKKEKIPYFYNFSKCFQPQRYLHFMKSFKFGL